MMTLLRDRKKAAAAAAQKMPVMTRRLKVAMSEVVREELIAALGQLDDPDVSSGAGVLEGDRERGSAVDRVRGWNACDMPSRSV
jgi:hypothetical protein